MHNIAYLYMAVGITYIYIIIILIITTKPTIKMVNTQGNLFCIRAYNT